MKEEEVDTGSGRVRLAEEFETNAFIMTVVNDSMEQKVIDTIRKSANTHGKIFVSELKDAIDIRIRPAWRICCTKIKIIKQQINRPELTKPSDALS